METACGAKVSKKLQFNPAGTFKVLQLTDLHYEPTESIISDNNKIIQTLVQSERPDLLLLSGDLISGWKVKEEPGGFAGLYSKIAATLDQLNVPWAFILGNHDREADLEPKEVLCLDAASKFSFTLHTNIFNPENRLDYILPIYGPNEEPQSWIILMDSGENTCKGEEWGGCVEEPQVKWLQSTFVPSLHQNKTAIYYQHQPIQQYNDVYHYFKTFGYRKEISGCPKYDTGVYDFLRSQNVHSMYVGHDHNNDFKGRMEDDGTPLYPYLIYGRKTGFGSYGPDFGIKRGARVVEMYVNQSLPTTWIRTADGLEPEQVLHLPRPSQYLKCGEDEPLDIVIVIAVLIPTLILVWIVARYLKGKVGYMAVQPE